MVRHPFPSEEFKRLCIKNGVSQSQIARYINTHASLINAVINNHKHVVKARLFLDQLYIDMELGEFTSLEDYKYIPPMPGRFIKRKKENRFPTSEFEDALKKHRLKRKDIARHLGCQEKEIIVTVYNYYPVSPYQRTSAFLLKIFEAMQAGTFTSLSDYEA